MVSLQVFYCFYINFIQESKLFEFLITLPASDQVDFYILACGLWEIYYLNRKKITMNWMAFCVKFNRDHAACLKNAINFLVPRIYEMNFMFF